MIEKEPIARLYVQYDKKGNPTWMESLADSTTPNTYRYDYIGEFAGEEDVFSEKFVGDYKTTEFYFKVPDKKHYMYLKEENEALIWKITKCPNAFEDVYRAFREYGVEFKEDIYENQKRDGKVLIIKKKD